MDTNKGDGQDSIYEMKELAIGKLLDSFIICSAVRDREGMVIDFTVEYVNDTACPFHGVDMRSSRGKRLLGLFPEFNSGEYVHRLAEVVNDNMPIRKKIFLKKESTAGEKVLKEYDVRVEKLHDGIAATWRNITAWVEEETLGDSYESSSTGNGMLAAGNQEKKGSMKKSIHRLQKQFEENTKKLDEALEYDKLKTEFFTNISHELKTPLNIVLSSLQLHELLSGNNSNGVNESKMQNLTNIMKQNCYRLLRMINNLIDATSIDTGFYKLYMQNCNIVSVIEEVALSAVAYAKNKDIDLQFDTEMEEIITACDPDKIERIILNLLSNAVKFNKKNGYIFVRTYVDRGFVCVSVKDGGIGIEKDKLDIIFQRFRQVDKSMTRSCEGCGIGLSLAKALTEMHGGTIEAKSELGEGSDFIIKLPLRRTQEEWEGLEYRQRMMLGDNLSGNEIKKVNIEFSDIYFSK